MNQEMAIFKEEIKDIQELQAKARKYDKLKEAVGKIKEEINDLVGYGAYYKGVNDVVDIIKKHTEGLI